MFSVVRQWHNKSAIMSHKWTTACQWANMQQWMSCWWQCFLCSLIWGNTTSFNTRSQSVVLQWGREYWSRGIFNVGSHGVATRGKNTKTIMFGVVISSICRCRCCDTKRYNNINKNSQLRLQVICLKDSYVYITQQDAPHKDKISRSCVTVIVTRSFKL
jgi:hypothetical protein